MAILGGLLATGCGAAPEIPYADVVAADRSRKDAAFAASSDSPILPATRAQFLPLGYFPIDENYRVPAMLSTLSEP